MNIFASSPNPYECATLLDSKRVIKMVLESCQLLSTAVNLSGGISPYRSTHINHPCSIWTRSSKHNYNWLLKHFEALLQEYTLRYGKIHKCQQYLPILTEGAKFIRDGEFTQFPNCTTYKHIENVHEAYRLYLNEKWKNDKRTPTWMGYV